jgi:RNA polymerase sigma-70 factor (ECF subfamily)
VSAVHIGSDARPAPAAGSDFRTTRWSLVLSAADPSAPQARQALDQLCGAYWHLLYAFVRRQGRDQHEAEDITQAFLAVLIEKNFLTEADPKRGRFRSFLLGALKHFLANDWHHRRRQKRGGGRELLSLDVQSAEAGYQLDPGTHVTPETLYERHWAETLLQRVIDRLRAEYVAAHKGALFAELREFLSESKATPHAEIAARHSISTTAVGVAIHRLRQRYAELLREEIAHTVSDPEDVEDEIRHLIAVLGR